MSGKELWYYHSEDYLHAAFVHEHYSIDENGNLIEYTEDAPGYVFLPTEEHYNVQEISVDAETYYNEMEWFASNFIRIPQTAFLPVVWSDVTDEADEENYPLRAEKMADALLALDQEFIKFSKE